MSQSLLSGLASDLYVVLTGDQPPPESELTYASLKQRIVHRVAQQPIDSMVEATLAATVLLYWTERGRNPKMQSLADAFWAVTSCIAAVSDAGGATTPLGKLLLGVVMGIGPGLQALIAAEGATHRQVPPPASALDPVVVQRLEHIASVLEQILEHRLATQPVEPPSWPPTASDTP